MTAVLTIVPTLRVGMQFVTLRVTRKSPRQAGLQFELHLLARLQAEGVAGSRSGFHAHKACGLAATHPQ
ncbi:hypothetical protein ALP47_03014 [Pseudomonas savastanoi]|nr:hypothetical protein ALP47_03014 [Pseudomonas savastanoi]